MKSPERRPRTPDERRRIARAATLWGVLALAGTVLVAAMAVWHLIRRGRLIRRSLPPPKAVTPLELPTTDPA